MLAEPRTTLLPNMQCVKSRYAICADRLRLQYTLQMKSEQKLYMAAYVQATLTQVF